MVDIGRNEQCICGSNKKYKNCCLLYKDNYPNREKNLLLFVGNGFTLNYLNQFKIDMNTSKPLTMFNSKKISYRDIFQYYHEFEELLSYPCLAEIDQFEYIDSILKRFKGADDLACYFNRFLTLIFSKFQLELNKSDYLRQWNLCKWLFLNQHYISDIISLNYDLLLEKTLSEANIDYARRFTTEVTYSNDSSINIFKPHGSIDFDILESTFTCPDEMRWRELVTKGNISRISSKGEAVYQDILNEDRWLIPRIQSDIIPPSQLNNLLEFSWIKQTYTELELRLKNIDCIINLGFSYSDPDQCEYNYVVERWKNKGKRTVLDFNTKELKLRT